MRCERNGCSHAHACMLAMWFSMPALLAIWFSIIVLPFFFRTLVVQIRFPIQYREPDVDLGVRDGIGRAITIGSYHTVTSGISKDAMTSGGHSRGELQWYTS